MLSPQSSASPREFCYFCFSTSMFKRELKCAVCCRFTPSHLPLSIQELDENQIGRFSFSSEETVFHVRSNETLGFISWWKYWTNATVNQPAIHWIVFFSYLFAAHEQTEYREPPGDSGLSGDTEERSDKCRQTGLFLSLGRKSDILSWGGCPSVMESTANKHNYSSTSTSTQLHFRVEPNQYGIFRTDADTDISEQ